MNRTFIRLAALVVLFSTLGCAGIIKKKLTAQFAAPGTPVIVPAYALQRTPWKPPHLIAGVGKADITPPPGFPTGGDGPAGNLARGYWTRLYARAFFVADAGGQTVVLVSVDTFAVPGGLTAMVAHDIGTKWNARGIVVRPDAILIAATHTHQGPGNFLTATTYNQFGSKFSGFSRPLFDFMVRQVTSAIDRAIDDALANDAAAQLIVRNTRADGLQLNRSPATFLLNPTSQALMSSFHEPVATCAPIVHRGEASQSGWDLPGCPRLRAADSTMTTLEVKRAGARIGVLIFFAIHPTVLDAAAPVNSGDFTEVAVSDLEYEWSSPAAAVVVGFFNGAEGDIVARREQRDVREVVEVARRFALHVKQALMINGDTLASPSISARREFIAAAAACGDAPSVALSPAPIPGTAALGGGEDDRSQLFALGWHGGVRYLARNGQGPKLPALDSDLLPAVQLTSTLGPPSTWPQALPLQFMRIGTLALAAFPGELSTAAGVLVRAQLSGYSSLVIVGLANEYINYIATPDEYGAQDYMAASTIWGPYEAAVFACRIRQLANDPNYVEAFNESKKTYSPGKAPEELKPVLSFGPAAVGDERAAPEEELETIVRHQNGAPARNMHFVEWREDIESVADEFTAASRRVIRVEVEQNGVWVQRPFSTGSERADDDTNVGFVSLLRYSPPSEGNGRTARYWRAFWITPLLVDVAPGSYRFEVETRDALGRVSVCRSDPFSFAFSEGRPPAHVCRPITAVAP